MEAENRSGGLGGAWLFGIVTGIIVIAFVVASYSAGLEKGRDEGRRQAGVAGRTATAPAPVPAGPGRELFVARCGSCHTLKAAGTGGKVGPKLDDLRPDAARVLAAIMNGGTGSGGMPKGLASGTEAQDISDFVSKASGSGGG